MRLRLPAPPRVLLWATHQDLHAYPNCSVPMEPTKSKNYMLALIVINQMGIRSQALSSRQRAPPSVYPSANGIKAPPHVGKSRVKWGVPVCGKRPWVGTMQERCQREDRLRHRVDMEHRCVWGAVEWTWNAAAFGRRRWQVSARGRWQRESLIVNVAG